MIRNIVFDMGQVLIHWWPTLFTSKMSLTPEDEELLITETFSRGEWAMMDHGTLTLEEGLARICARLPQRLHPCAEQLVNGWWDLELYPVEGMSDLIAELKAKGYGLYVLSNAATNYQSYFGRIPGTEHFDGVYVSAVHKLAKPEKEIYLSFLDTFSLKAETCFFIDDRADNIEGAAGVGIRGTIFNGDLDLLRSALRAAGVDCSGSANS